MAINIFGSETKDSIRVGRISPENGLDEDVSVCEANRIAKLNPGTQFSFRSGDTIKFLNINEVNKLTSNDLKSPNKCPGINLDAKCGGPPTVNFYGGGGIGAKANAIVGKDGAVLALDLISGGYGYQYPPIVEVSDRCGLGNGVVATAILGEVSEIIETFGDSDLEIYEICPPDDVGYGKLYGPNGKEVGNWDPRLYISSAERNNQIELRKYQDFLKNIKNPWFTTRKNPPKKVTFQNKTTTVKYDVKSKAWNEFMNSHAISPVPASDAKSSDFADVPFILEWEQQFPFNGEYIFRGLCDSKSTLYIDGEKIADLNKVNNSPTVIKRTVKSGLHKIRIDLRNEPVLQVPVTPTIPAIPVSTPTTATTEKTVPGKATVEYYKEGSNYFVKVDGDEGVDVTVDFSYYASGDNTSFGSGVGFTKLTIDTEGGPQSIVRKKINPDYDTYTIKSCKFKTGKKYKINFEGRGFVLSNNNWVPLYGTQEPTISPSKKTLVIPDGTIRVTPDNKITDQGRITAFTLEGYGLNLFVKNVSNRVVTTSVVQSIPTKSLASNLNQGPISNYVFNTADFIGKANRKLWRSNFKVDKESDFVNRYGVLPFNPDTGEAQTESYQGRHSIVWNNVTFPKDGNYIIEIMADDSVVLDISSANQTPRTKVVINHQGFDDRRRSTGKRTEKRFFKAGTYRIGAELFQSSGLQLAKGNNMFLAVNIQSELSKTPVALPKSWNENPVGVALVIDAPPPPQPKLAPPQQEGRCPNNPTWSTRFSNSKERWWNVNSIGARGDAKAWGAFMNLYAISPIPPLNTEGTDGGNVVYRNEWEIEAPQDGTYALQAAADSAAEIFIDGKLVMSTSAAGGAPVVRPPSIPAVTSQQQRVEPPKGLSPVTPPASKVVIPEVKLPVNVVGTLRVIPPPPETSTTKRQDPLDDSLGSVVLTTTSALLMMGTAPERLNRNQYEGAKNRNPELRWSFAGLPSGVTIESYTILMENTSQLDVNVGSNTPPVHWDITVPKEVTSIPAGASPDAIWPSGKKRIIGTTYLGENPGIDLPIGYIGPQPPLGEVNSYKISVIANLVGSNDKLVVTKRFLVNADIVQAPTKTLSGDGSPYTSRTTNNLLISVIDPNTKKEINTINTVLDLKVIPPTSSIPGTPPGVPITPDKLGEATLSMAGINPDSKLYRYRNAENKNPRVEWDFKLTDKGIGAGIGIKSYELIMEDLTTPDPKSPDPKRPNAAVLWNLVINNKTWRHIDADIKDSNYAKNANIEIKNNYLGKPGEPSWVNNIGYSGPQPPYRTYGTYKLTVIATLEGNTTSKLVQSVFFDYPKAPEKVFTNTNRQFESRTRYPRNVENGVDKNLQIKTLTLISPATETVTTTTPPTSTAPSVTASNEPKTFEVPDESLSLVIKPKDSEELEEDGVVPISMIGNSTDNPNKYSNAGNVNPEVTWSFGTLPKGVNIDSYRIVLEDRSNTETIDGQEKLTLHWDITVPKETTSIPTDVTDPKTIWKDVDPATFISPNYLSRQNKTSGVSRIGYSGPQPPLKESHTYRLSVTANLSGNLTKESARKLTQSKNFSFNNPDGDDIETIDISDAALPREADNIEITYTEEPTVTPDSAKTITPTQPVKEISIEEKQRNIANDIRTYLNTTLNQLRDRKITNPKNQAEIDQKNLEIGVINDLLNAANSQSLNTNTKVLTLVATIQFRIANEQKLIKDKKIKESKKIPLYQKHLTEIQKIENPPPPVPPTPTVQPPAEQKVTPTNPVDSTVGKLVNSKENNPEPKKITLTKGKHTIRVEVINNKSGPSKLTEQKIFSTKDWIPSKSAPPQITKTFAPGKATVEYYKEGSNYFVKVDGDEGVDVTVDFTYDIAESTEALSGVTFRKLTIETEEGPKSINRRIVFPSDIFSYSIKSCKFKTNKKYKITIEGAGDYVSGGRWVPSPGKPQAPTISPTKKTLFLPDRTLQVIGGKIYDLGRVTSLTLEGIGLNLNVRSVSNRTILSSSTSQIVSTSKTAPGIVYEGPTVIANYKKDYISPKLKDVNSQNNEELQGKTWKFRWTNVNFPETGQYALNVEGDDKVIIRINGLKVAETKMPKGDPEPRKKINFNTVKGRKTVEIELINRAGNGPTGFWPSPEGAVIRSRGNPALAFLEITRLARDSKDIISNSWKENPIGVSAVLTPPPCPRKIRGRGQIKGVDIKEPGNGFSPDPDPKPKSSGPDPDSKDPDPKTPNYPVALVPNPEPIIPTNPGSTYNCGEDKIFVNDIEFRYECEGGRITTIYPPPNFPPITRTPEIRIETETGVGLEFTIPLQVIRDPVDVPPQQLLQVTDLVGLKQTGYVNGRPYYGAIFYENGIAYAGFYRTPGPLVRVYATLQESIDAEVTTPPSAIQRQGTDIVSNNPRLNIPGTPQDLI